MLIGLPLMLMPSAGVGVYQVGPLEVLRGAEVDRRQAELVEWCRARLAHYKVPTKVRR